MQVFPAKDFPARPLVGTFELYSSTPSLDGVDPRVLQSEIFQQGQRIHIRYVGEYGSDRPELDVYNISMLPPFPRGICLQPGWSFVCPSYDGSRVANDTDQPPTYAISHEAYLQRERLKTDEEVGLFYSRFGKYGLKRGDFIYVLSYADSRASYAFYFKDWDTIISRSAYEIKSGSDIVLVDQVLKRVKEP